LVFSLFYFMVLKSFYFTFILCTWKGLELLFLTTTLWGSTKLTMLTLELIKKKERVGVFSTMFSIHRCVFHSHKIWKRVKENNEKKKEQKKIKKSTTLDLDLHLDSSNHELSFKLLNFFFFFKTDWFSLQNDAM